MPSPNHPSLVAGRRLRGLAACGILTIAFLFAAACGDEDEKEQTRATIDTEAGSTSDAPVADAPPGCDASAEPKDAPACVVDSFGVFVDAKGGADANPGTKASPLKTIGAALSKLGGKPRIYICESTYPEALTLTAATHASLFGGFACGAWSYSGGKPKLSPPNAGAPLSVTSVATALVVADLRVEAQPGNASAPSSIAAFVVGSPSLTLRRVELVAGAGADGRDETKAADGALASSTPIAGTLVGNSGDLTIGGAAQLCTCVGGATSKGGGGGNINSNGSPGETAQATPDPATATGEPGTVADCLAGAGSFVNGRPGSNAPPALAADGAKSLGTLSASGWEPAPGKNATYGAAGQGGGGGGGSAGGGGGGGCGGCGGAGGKGGGGGGASVALLALDSPVTLLSSSLVTAKAGRGGNGGQGGDGINGGGKGNQGGGACPGGNGGRGGNGGAGGGGAGGLSVGVLYKGPKPSLGGAQVARGAAGPKGIGPAGNDGVEGQTADELAIP